jgi:hypothetical protein
LSSSFSMQIPWGFVCCGSKLLAGMQMKTMMCSNLYENPIDIID